MTRDKTMVTEKLKRLSLRNKIFLLTIAVTFLPSVAIAFLTTQVIVSNLTSRLEQRAIGIARTIEENSRSHILTQNASELTGLLQRTAPLTVGEPYISYICIVDKEERILARIFHDVFPEKLPQANKIPFGKPYRIINFQIGEDSFRDIAVPIIEGAHQIGAVHVGLNTRFIDALTGKLLMPLVGLVFAIILVFFGIGYGLSGYITKPMSRLAKMSDEISRGNLDIDPEVGTQVRCWEMRKCGEVDCPAYNNTDRPCWYIDDTHSCGTGLSGFFLDKREICEQCDVYQKNVGDEFVQLTHSLRNMIIRLRTSEAGLRESERKYRSLFDSGPNPMFVLDHDTFEILDANPSAEKTYEYPREELIGRPFTDLGTFEYAGGASANLEEDWYKGYTVSQKVRHYKKANRPFYVNIHCCPMRYGDRDAIIVATTDVTEMMEKEAQLIQASKMTSLGQMSAGIAHELNQPLNAIRLGNDFLKKMAEDKKMIPEDTLLRLANEVMNQVDRAASIINRLREFGRKAELAKDKIDINGPVKEVLGIIGQQLNLQNIEVGLDLEKDLPCILAHNNRMEQVIFNLVTNARDAINEKHSAEAGFGNRIIGVRTFVDGDLVTLTISDTGMGIPEFSKDKIFEPFFTTKETGKGMGLGLSIVYGIVRDYDGEIHFESREGEGTTFRLTFPLAPE
jgi:histidine kinase